MKNLYDETSKFTMADDDDYDEYEEEVVERDEEYEPEDDGEYEDEEYEDDGEYEDEEYEEEPEEEYDDGYDDQYYDDRLNQVLDELAELKRSIAAPAPVQQPTQQPPIMPLQPHLLYSMPQGGNNEGVMYNEISRLRDELAKTQNSQTLHVEMSRLKEEMEREHKQNEAQFLAEIKRLNEKIEELQEGKNPPAPALNGAAPVNAGLLPEPQQPAVSSKEMNKLVNVSESLLHATRDNNARILSEVADLKEKVEAAKLGDEFKKSIDNAVTTLKELQSSPAPDSDTLMKVHETLLDVKTAIEALAASTESVKSSVSALGESTTAAPATVDSKLVKKLLRLKSSNAVDLTEVIRSVFEIKGMLGSNDPNQQALVNMALKAYTDLDLLHITLANTSDFRMKLEAVENFVSAVNAQDFITSDALGAYNIVLKQLLDTPVDKAVFDSLCSFAGATGKITISSVKKEAVYKYIVLAERAKHEDLDSVMEFLSELVTAINEAEGSDNVASVGSLYDDIVKNYEERKALTSEEDRNAAETELKALIAELCDIHVGDIVTYAPVMPLPTSDAVQFAEGDSVSDRLNALMQSVDAISRILTQNGAPQAVAVEEGVANEGETTVEAVQTAPMQAAIADVAALQNSIAALEAKLDLDAVTEQLQRNFAALTTRLANIEGRLASGVSDTAEEAGAEFTEEAPAVTVAENAFVSEEIQTALAEIKDKLVEQEVVVDQVADLRATVASVLETVSGTASFDKLYEDIVAQFDKLYDDLAAVHGESDDKLGSQLTEIKEAIDGIAATDVSSAVLDGIIDFRAAYEDGVAAAATDRAKLMEDVAVVRDQAEQLTAAQAQITEQLTATQEQVTESLATAQTQAEESQAQTLEAVKALDEKLAALQESESASAQDGQVGRQAIVDKMDAIDAALAEIKEKSAVIEETVNNNSIFAAENQTAITEDIARVLEQLTPPENSEQTANMYDEIVSISDRIDEIRSVYEQQNAATIASLAEIKEQVHLKELEQNLAAVSASEEEKQTLLTEIASLRERISTLETEQQTVAETTATQLGAVLDQISELSGSVHAEETAAVRAAVESIDARLNEYVEGNAATGANTEKLLQELAEVKEKLENTFGEEENSLNLQVLMADVAEMKEHLAPVLDTSSEIVKMQDDITFIRNQIEANIEGTEEDPINASLENEGMSLMMDDIAAIKDKLASFEEYDTVAEILSLREEVKNARLLDSGDVATELENVKNDLLDLKADLADIKAASVEQGTALPPEDGAPSGDEVNMLLNEIVSLRDEIQAYKDDVANLVSGAREEQSEMPNTAVADESITVILDELTGLHNELDGLKEESLAAQAGEIEEIKSALSELKDMISRRTSIAETDATTATASNELNVVLDEIVNVKDEVAALKDDFTAATENVAAARESDALAEKAAFADEMQSFKNELYALINDKLQELSAVSPEVSEDLQSLKDQIADLQLIAAGNVGGESSPETTNALIAELRDVKQMLSEQAAQPAVATDTLYEEIAALREELAARQSEPVAVPSVDLGEIREELTALREQLQAMPAPAPAEQADDAVLGEVLGLREELAALREQMQTPATAQTDDTVLGEVLGLREELAALREQISATPEATEKEPDTVVLGEVLGLREELAALREQMQATPAAEDTGDNAVLGEVLALREDLAAINGSEANETGNLLETVEAIKEDVRALKEEPDLGIINEVLALRDEFQAFKDEINKARTTPVETKPDSELLSQVQALRDQMFAISMANVNNGTDSEGVYESYNNIILDEISALRDEIALLKRTDETKVLGEELSQMKDKLTNLAVDDSEKTEARFKEIRNEIASLKSDTSSQTAVLQEIADLRQALENRRDADAATLNFMSELARLVERQNEYLGNASNASVREDIESLKEEIAASLSSPEMRAVAAESVIVDNSAVLDELAQLRQEIKKSRSGNVNKQILRELADLRERLGMTTARETSENNELSRSINDLKAELNQIAGFVDDDKTPPKAPAQKWKRGRKPTKSNAKPAQTEQTGLGGNTLIDKIDLAGHDIAKAAQQSNNMALNPEVEAQGQQPIPATGEVMDIASRIAKQVANKLIMEQLVEQLGDGNVASSEVEEIVKDILPQEFTTVAVDEQTDKVRRLANSLVLDKLRARLKK